LPISNCQLSIEEFMGGQSKIGNRQSAIAT